ncbi:hypothetical protein C0991_012066 [Blastosporella zonata]|nr:hypothetical protein C0991_012066 [Blastosporella zonata]
MPTLLAPSGPTWSPNDPPVVVAKIEAGDFSLSGKKKKKKRRREEGGDDGGSEGGVTEKKKKKKKKRRRLDDGTVADEEPADVAADQPDDAQPGARQKQKDKGRQFRAIEPQIDPSLLSSEPQGSATALLSAIVAAATGSSASTHDAHIDPGLAPQSPPQGPIHLNPYMAYVYGHQNLVPRNPTPSPPPPPTPPQTLFPTPTMFPTPTLFPTGTPNIPFSELTFGSNEDVLRALQSLDMAKITSVLKNIGEVTAATITSDSTTTQPPTPAVQVHPGPILGNPSEETDASVPRRGAIDVTLPVPQQATRSDHAHLLSSKWMNATKLGELARTEGLIYKKGKFSAIEEEQLETAIENFRVSRGLTEDQIQALIFPQSERTRDNIFWCELSLLAAAVPMRPIIAVYHHIRRTHHPMKKQGVWNADEDDALHKAVVDHGQAWEKISPLVGRMPADCRDRYRNHLVNRDIRVTGSWSKDEEDLLTRIVTDMTVKQGKPIDNDIFWGRVSELMGGTRGRQQCRIKWTDNLAKDIKAGGKGRWSPEDAYILVHKVGALNVSDDTEIDWKMLPDPVWNVWSAHHLQRRWITMKRGIKGWEDMTHQEIVDILRIRKSYVPNRDPSKKRSSRKITSAEIVEEGAEGAVSASDVPGSSTGPGTIAGENNEDASSSSDSE